MFFISCQSTLNVENPYQLIPCSTIITEGKIYADDKKNDYDIFIYLRYTAETPYMFLGIQKALYSDKIKIFYQDMAYDISISYIKVTEKKYSNNADTIKIKINNSEEKYKISTLNGINNWYYYSTEISGEMVPAAIASFQIGGRLFYVLACKYYNDTNTHDIWELVLLKDQQFAIVDEAGNEYASFTKSDFKICDQPDSESYDFIPLIAAYSYIFSFVR